MELSKSISYAKNLQNNVSVQSYTEKLGRYYGLSSSSTDQNENSINQLFSRLSETICGILFRSCYDEGSGAYRTLRKEIADYLRVRTSQFRSAEDFTETFNVTVGGTVEQFQVQQKFRKESGNFEYIFSFSGKQEYKINVEGDEGRVRFIKGLMTEDTSLLKPKDGVDVSSMIEELKTANEEEFNSFITALRNEPKCYFRYLPSGTLAFIPGLPFNECICCNSNAHNRLVEGNGRTKVEQFILEKTERLLNSKTEITCLSVGAGGMLQELMLLAQLANQGFRKIQLILIDPDYGSPELKDLTAIQKVALGLIANRLQKLYAVEIQLRFHPTIDSLNVNDSFDVVYAIDYEPLTIRHDYSSRQLVGRNATTKKMANLDQKPAGYQAAMDFIKALALVKAEPTSFAALSKGRDMMTYCNSSQPSTNRNNATITQLFIGQEKQPKFDTIYIYSNIATLIYNLDFLSRHKMSTLLINNLLVNEEDKSYVDTLLKKYGIAHVFISELEAVNYIRDQDPDHEILIVDYSLYDSEMGEDILPKEFLFNDKHISIIRTDVRMLKNLDSDMACKATFIYPKLPELKSAEPFF